MQLLYTLYKDDLDSKHMRPLSIEVKHLRDSGEVSSIGLLLGLGRYEIRGSVGKGWGPKPGPSFRSGGVVPWEQ